MSAKTFYVYEHWRPDKDVCFYVGKGKHRRAWDLRKRNPHHTSIISKLTSLGLSVDVRIIARELTEQEAFDLECARIALYSRGALCNMTDGGEGASGWIPSGEYRAAMSAKHVGKAKSLEHCAAISAGRKGMKFSAEHARNVGAAKKGKTLSAAHRAKMSAAHKGKIRTSEHAAKLRQALLGRKHTPEALAKMATVRREWWATRKRVA